ncbi:DNA-directed RNA polymerase III subunit RPC6-like isoform X2 [Pecten maximus]|uniref:DNA-directed RNA polymerase III subunit RPC6-like isoform X2 n=1 Tax=Pecten maximus TaxID=6579 RepID=UPI001458CCF1|nr:DNA-directed RNA polymerase III subunit RPC6-like isoform X2 [Pecten maximus]
MVRVKSQLRILWDCCTVFSAMVRVKSQLRILWDCCNISSALVRVKSQLRILWDCCNLSSALVRVKSQLRILWDCCNLSSALVQVQSQLRFPWHCCNLSSALVQVVTVKNSISSAFVGYYNSNNLKCFYIGIWIRDIRYKCNLLLTQVNKILKNLESKKLIKAVKSVAASKKKVYMLYNLEPDRTVTGGAWYSDQDFESEFVEVLNQQCFKYLEQKASLARENQVDPIAQRNAAFTSLSDVWKYISELGISKVQLSVDDIETIMDTLIYDGKVERSVTASTSSGEASSKLYRAMKPLVPTTGLMRMPCGSCPVFDQCCEGGPVSPTNCVYMKEWLEY